MGGILGLLILGPLALALAVLLLPAPWWRRAAVGGAFVLALAGLIACRAAGREGPDARAAWEAPGGLLDRELARRLERGIDPLERDALREALLDTPGPEVSGPEATAADRLALERVTGLYEARATLHDVERLHAGDAQLLGEAQGRVREARAHLAALQARQAALQRDLAGLAAAVDSPRGRELRLVVYEPWLPGLGLSWFLGVDALGGALLLAIGLCGLAAAVGLPPGLEARAPMAACLALQGVLAGAIACQDAALLWGFLLLAQLPVWLLLLGDDGPLRARLAEVWVLVALGSALPLGAALAAAAHTVSSEAVPPGGGAAPVFALPRLAGALPGPLQGWLVGAALLLALPRLLPLGGAFGLRTQLARTPGPARALVQVASVGAAGWVLLAVLAPLAPDALGRHSTGRLGLAGLGVLALLGGVLSAWLNRRDAGLVAGLVQARAGLVALGLAAGGEAGLLGAALGLLSLAASGGAAQLALAGLERGGGDLAQRLARRPLLARVAALALLFLAGLPGSGGFLAGLLVLEGARGGLAPLFGPLIALGLLGLWVVTLRAVAGAVRALRDGKPAGAAQDVSLTEAWGIMPLLLLELVAGILPRVFLDPLLPACARLAGELRP